MSKTAKHLDVEKRHIYNPEFENCPHCGQQLRTQRHYQWRKTIQRLDSVLYAISQAKVCANPACVYTGNVYKSAKAQMLSLPKCTDGLDVIAQIGWWRDKEFLNRKQIHARLIEKGIRICEREVDYLYERYQVLMGCAERMKIPRLREVAQEQGGLIISLDGLDPEGASEQLWIVREVREEMILAVAWLPRVNHETLGNLLKPVIELGLPILATISDKQGCVRKAVEEVLPDTPHQWCQSHYLGNVTRPVYEYDSKTKTELRKTIREEIRESMKEVLSVPETDFSPSDYNGSGCGYSAN